MRELKTLNIRDMKHLAMMLRTSAKELDEITSRVEGWYYRNEVTRNGKVRHTATPTGRFRQIVDRLQDLLQRVRLPSCVHGGRRGCSNMTNAAPHTCQPMVVKLDIEDFFPSISHRSVYRAFTRLGCTPDVARILTRLTTLDGCLPQGSPTSTILAAHVVAALSRRLERLATLHGAIFTQYVDDLTLSGPRRIQGLVRLVEKIIRQEGLRAKRSKTQMLHSDEEQVVTGVRVNHGFDVPSEKVREAREQIDTIARQKDAGVEPNHAGLVSLRGKIRYVGRLNKGAGRHLAVRLERVLSA